MARVRDPIYGTIEVDIAASTTETFVIPGSGQYTKMALAVPDHANFAALASVTLNGMVPGASSGGTPMPPEGVIKLPPSAPGSAWRITKGTVNIIDMGIPMGRDWELVLVSSGGGELVVDISFVLYGHPQRTSAGRA